MSKKPLLQAKLAAVLAGKQAEQDALNYLERNGLSLLQRNFRCKAGEIDLIMQDEAVVVFVEVKYRHDQQFGGALLSIQARQKQRIIQAAQYFLMRYAPDAQARFDIIILEHQRELQWLPNAFDADY